MIESNGRNLVFIFSTPRAGSTLLSVILGNHSKIYCPNEPWFLLQLNAMYEDQIGAKANYDHTLARRAFKELCDRNDYQNFSREFALNIYNKELSKQNKTLFVDKTPRYYYILNFIEELFPEAKKIWLKRNPLDVAASYLTTWDVSVDELIGNMLSSHSFDLTLGLHNFSSFFSGKENQFELSYENLVENPKPVLLSLFHFLNLEYEEDIENYSKSSSSLSKMSQNIMGDKKIFLEKKPHKRSLGNWAQVLSTESTQNLLDNIGNQIFERMGYSKLVDDLRSKNFSFPSPEVVAQKIQLLSQFSKMEDCTSGRKIDELNQKLNFESSELNGAKLKISDLEKYKEKMNNDFWVNLGKKIGFMKS